MQERLSKGSAYYKDFMRENLRQLFGHMAEVERFTRVAQYLNGLEELDQMLMKTLGEIERAAYIVQCVLNGEEINTSEVSSQLMECCLNSFWERYDLRFYVLGSGSNYGNNEIGQLPSK